MYYGDYEDVRHKHQDHDYDNCCDHHDHEHDHHDHGKNPEYLSPEMYCPWVHTCPMAHTCPMGHGHPMGHSYQMPQEVEKMSMKVEFDEMDMTRDNGNNVDDTRQPQYYHRPNYQHPYYHHPYYHHPYYHHPYYHHPYYQPYPYYNMYAAPIFPPFYVREEDEESDQD